MSSNRRNKYSGSVFDAERAAKAARAAYMREWRSKNREKVRANNEIYWLRKAIKQAKESGWQIDPF